MRTKTPISFFLFGLTLAACSTANPGDAPVERQFDDATVVAEVSIGGDVVAEVIDPQGELLATMDWSAEASEGSLVVEASGEVHELSIDDERVSVDAVCELAYQMTTRDYDEPDGTQFRAGQAGCDGFQGPGCCFAGMGGYFCEYCWGANGYYDVYCGPFVY